MAGVESIEVPDGDAMYVTALVWLVPELAPAITHIHTHTGQALSTQQSAQQQELDFVFITQDHRPYRVRQVDGAYWICYMHPDRHWVLLRKVKDSMEMWRMQAACIEWEHHHYYEFGLAFSKDKWPTQQKEKHDLVH